MPNTLERSVRARAGIPSAAAASTASSMRMIPSTIEYSLCNRRWMNDGDMRLFYSLARACVPPPAGKNLRKGIRHIGSVHPRDAPAAALELGEHAAPAEQVQRAHGHERAALLQPRLHALRHAHVALVEQPLREALARALRLGVAAPEILADAPQPGEIAREVGLDHAVDHARQLLVGRDRPLEQDDLVGIRHALEQGDLLVQALQLVHRLALLAGRAGEHEIEDLGGVLR